MGGVARKGWLPGACCLPWCKSAHVYFVLDFHANYDVMGQWVKTDMGTEAGHLMPEESANGGLNLLSSHSVEDTGKFFVIDLPGKDIGGQSIYDGAIRPY